MNSSRDVAIIVNPTSGSGHGRTLLAQLRDRFADAGRQIRIEASTDADDVTRLVRRHAVGETVIGIAGGDGTINCALEGLVGKSNPLLIIPLGTENLLARQLGIAADVDALWQLVNAGRASPFDLATLNGRPFATIVGAGFDGEVVARLTRERRGHITHLDYFWPIWRTFWHYRFPAIRVVADGREISNEPALVFVGNIPRYAVGLQILNRARWDDGKLDLCVMRCTHQGPLLEHVFRTMLNWHVEHPLVSYHQVEHVQLESEVSLPLQVDGDAAGELPAEIKVMPAAIRLLIPPQRAAAVGVEQRSA